MLSIDRCGLEVDWANKILLSYPPEGGIAGCIQKLHCSNSSLLSFCYFRWLCGDVAHSGVQKMAAFSLKGANRGFSVTVLRDIVNYSSPITFWSAWLCHWGRWHL